MVRYPVFIGFAFHDIAVMRLCGQSALGVKIMRLLLCFGLLLSFSAAADEPRFNALDPSDPSYIEYQQNLCDYTLAEIRRESGDLYWMNSLNPHMDNASAQRRQDWAVDYVVAVALLEQFSSEYDLNCRAVQ